MRLTETQKNILIGVGVFIVVTNLLLLIFTPSIRGDWTGVIKEKPVTLHFKQFINRFNVTLVNDDTQDKTGMTGWYNLSNNTITLYGDNVTITLEYSRDKDKLFLGRKVFVRRD